MKNIIIADTTLCSEEVKYSFKEKIEIARQLENLNVDIIELPSIENVRTDILLVKTVSSFVKNSVISVGSGMSSESIENAALSLVGAKHGRIRIELPVSPVGMEYICHKKPDKMLPFIEKLVSLAKDKSDDVEFCAIDATRAEDEFLYSAINTAINAGATSVSIYDSAAETMMPDQFANFAADIINKTEGKVSLGVFCENKNGMAVADALLAVRSGVEVVKTSVSGNAVPLETFAEMIKNCGNSFGLSTGINYTQLGRIIKQINWIADNSKSGKTAAYKNEVADENIILYASDSREAVMTAVLKLGYDLSDDDQIKVYEEFQKVAAKKEVGSKELEAIVASVALQVPATYKLVSYVLNNGNIIASSAQVTLEKDGNTYQGISIGDGPIAAAFLAIEQITGTHYELDDFQIQSVTEGKEAMGSALVKLRANGKLYSGNGISTDIIGAGIKAYLSAVNKIVYEEA
ncbi:MAG: alpha-isopropylmalate synthase regulatory domain-containing protein [Acutalibacteraceae bacterium]|nr:alpha-isopropylmalate synthase regulatory domain-containing protein [Acutalibacteraceae bacterium]